MRKSYSIVTAIILLVLIITCLKGNPIALKEAEKDTMAYLTEKGYAAEDIEFIRAEFDRKRKDKYYVRVVLKEDSEIEWLFVYDGEENIYRQGEK